MKVLRKIILFTLLIILVPLLCVGISNKFLIVRNSELLAANASNITTSGEISKGTTSVKVIKGTEDGNGNYQDLEFNKAAYTLIYNIGEVNRKIEKYKDASIFQKDRIRDEIQKDFKQIKENETLMNMLNNKLTLNIEQYLDIADKSGLELIDRVEVLASSYSGDQGYYTSDISNIMNKYGFDINDANAETIFCLFSGQPFPDEIRGTDLYFYEGYFGGIKEEGFVDDETGIKTRVPVYLGHESKKLEKVEKISALNKNAEDTISFNPSSYTGEHGFPYDFYYSVYVKRSVFSEKTGISEKSLGSFSEPRNNKR